MAPLKIEATIDTPEVILDAENNHFEISGKSYPEDTREFYGPVLAWMNNYITNPNPETHFIFKLRYFNSSSYKPIFDILTRLSSIKNYAVITEWYYKKGDDDMREAGEEFAELLGMKFTYHVL